MIIPVVVGVIVLGKAFDLYHVSPSEHQIFVRKDIEENLQVIPQTCSQKNYGIVKSASDVNQVLNLDPYISLKAKNKDASLVGLQSYLSTVVNRNKTIEVLMVVNLETETNSFPSRLQTESDWRNKPQAEVGTHYVSSIKYGGLLVASLRLHPKNPADISQIERIIASKIPSTGSINELFFKNLESVVASVHKKASVSIQVVSTAGEFAPPTNVLDLEKLVKEYHEIVSRVNSGKGNPLKLELDDLHRVQSNYTRFYVKPELEMLVEEANEKLEDLRIASKILKDWYATNTSIGKQEEELIKAFEDRLHAAEEALSSAITNLHYDGEITQFDEAFEVYNKLKDSTPYRYTYTIDRFISTISDKSFLGRFYFLFIRWMKKALGL